MKSSKPYFCDAAADALPFLLVSHHNPAEQTVIQHSFRYFL